MITFSNQPQQGFKPNPLDKSAQERLLTELSRCAERVDKASKYDNPRDFVALPGDAAYQQRIIEQVERVRATKPDIIIFIGIGGSLLGTQALYEAFKNTLIEEKQLLIFFDIIDPDALYDFFAFVHEMPEVAVHLVIVSKSGTTLETSINASCVVGYFEQLQKPLLPHQVTVITDHSSPLWLTAKTVGYSILEIPHVIGGRYSVFSAVGLFLFSFFFPDAREELLAGAQAAVVDATNSGETNSAYASAQFLYACHQAGYRVHDTFIFGSEYEPLGKWYRQLMGESLGKRVNNAGERVETGMLPTISMGSADLHSMAQFYFGGPRIVVSSLIFVQPACQDFMLPANQPLSVIKSERSMHGIMRGLFECVVKTYEKEARPVMTWSLEKSPYDLAYFMQMKLFEVVYLAALFDVNAFDQPEVELYKNEVRGLLEG